MHDLWHEWIADNPFLKYDLCRWARRGYAWKLTLAALGFTIPAILLAHWVNSSVSLLHAGRTGRVGLLLFSLVSILHLVITLSGWQLAFSLVREATAERLDFIRLMPMAPRELMVKIGAARAVMRILPVLLMVPVYVLLLAFGGVRLEDVAAVYLVFASMLFAPPGLVEIATALTAKYRGGAATADARSARGAQGNPAAVVWMITFQIGLQLLMPRILVPLITSGGARLARIVGPGLGSLLPLSVFASVARFISTPQPFYGWVLVPLVPLFFYWVARRFYIVSLGAEAWTREPEVEPLPNGRTNVSLPDTSGREEERRQRRVLGGVSACILILLAAGIFWPSIASGTMGGLVRVFTPEGGLAALLGFFGAISLIPPFERLRSGSAIPVSTFEALADAGREAVGGVARTLGVLLLAAFLGRVAPWPTTGIVLAQLCVAAVPVTLFALGWRGVFGKRPGDSPGAPPRQASPWMVLPAVLTYLLPLILLTQRGLPIPGHYLAAVSPLYALCAILPGLWRATPLLPMQLAVAPSLLIGLVLLAVAPRSRLVRVRPVKVRTYKDPLEVRLVEMAQRWDNPLFTAAVYRLLRQPVGLLARLLWGVAFGLVLPAALILLILLQTRGGTSWASFSLLAALSAPAFGPEWRVGAVAGLLTATAELFMLFQIVPVAFASGPSTEQSLARRQQRLHYLLMSPLTDRQIVWGILATGLLQMGPVMVAALLTSVFWLLMALGYGASFWTVTGWLAIFALVVVLALHSGLSTYDEWRRRGRLQIALSVVRALAIVMLPSVLILGGIIPLVSGMADLNASLPVVTWITVAAAALALVTLPLSTRRAVAMIHGCRLEDDLERSK